MRTNFFIPDPGRNVMDGQGVSGEKKELPLFQRDLRKVMFLWGNQENEILGN